MKIFLNGICHSPLSLHGPVLLLGGNCSGPPSWPTPSRAGEDNCSIYAASPQQYREAAHRRDTDSLSPNCWTVVAIGIHVVTFLIFLTHFSEGGLHGRGGEPPIKLGEPNQAGKNPATRSNTELRGNASARAQAFQVRERREEGCCTTIRANPFPEGCGSKLAFGKR